jgi:alkylation response protein AidB-like acyl-CoA dehydrogenase
MSSLIMSRRDIDFLLFDWLRVDELTSRARYADHNRQSFSAALDLYEKVAVESFAPHNKSNDSNEPRLDGGTVRINPPIGPALKLFADAGLIAAAQDYQYGGMQLPIVIEKAGHAWLQAANPATTAYASLSIGNVNLLLTHGSPEQIRRFARPILEGRSFGTMCLSEPQAGSSLADIRTRAEPQADGSYRLFGHKMWTSAADHDLDGNIIHLVLARIPGDPPGVRGISLFLAPKFLVEDDGRLGERNDTVAAGLNHKMGYRGTTNCAFNFGEGAYRPGGAAGAVGYLVGDKSQGLAYMFHMMNEARIAVGLGAASIGYTGYLHALDYARTRVQGRPLGARDPSLSQIPIVEHPDVKRMLLAQKAYVEGALALTLYCARLVDEKNTAASAAARAQAGLLLDLLTPIAKSWPSQWCLEANSLAIQVHGGYGYTRDYNVEQFYRDNRLNPIHEGTHGIHALDLLGRKVAMNDGAALRLLAREFTVTIGWARATRNDDLAAFATALERVLARIVETTKILHGADGPRETMANASLYLEAFGHAVVAWIWLQQALAAIEHNDDFHLGKLQAARYFFRWELPRIEPQLDLLSRLDRTCADMSAQWF